MVHVNWTNKAESALDSIYEYIAQDAPHYAAQFIKQLIGSVDQVELYILCGRIVPEVAQSAIREIIFHNYRVIVIYQVLDSEHADILTVIHCSRDLANPALQPWDLP